MYQPVFKAQKAKVAFFYQPLRHIKTFAVDGKRMKAAPGQMITAVPVACDAEVQNTVVLVSKHCTPRQSSRCCWY